MLNYIWAGLIVFSLVFALATDAREIAQDRYRNDAALPVELHFPDGYATDARRQSVEIRIRPEVYQAFYATDAAPERSYAGTLVQTQDGRQVRFGASASLPEPVATIREVTAGSDDELRAVVQNFAATGRTVSAALRFEPVRFVKMTAITQAAFDFAETAVNIIIGLIGALALWLGLLRIAEKSGLVGIIVKLVRPVLRPLFPGVPKDHPALGVIALNLSANMLGLGNAATPLGIKAMEELHKLNKSEDTATDDMVMLLAMNTASVQLVPPVLLVAIMGLQINELIFSIIIVTGCSLLVAIAAAKLLSKMRRYRATDPDRRRASAKADTVAEAPDDAGPTKPSDPA
ncbi:MAG: nucleoside recognition protein [Bacteroidetes bacterium]|jgi:spore maturation protein A|nr:nucleoside recognition protein [Bacteroidota bacterium]